MLSCLVENPPVAVVAIEWHTASKSPMPPHMRRHVSMAVSRKYTIQISRAMTRVLEQILS